jgi:hypothetical protein
MPNFPWPGRGTASANDDAALAGLLSGTHVPEDLPAALQPAADVLAALRARPSTNEVAGLTAAMAEFRERVGAPDPSRRTPRRRPALLTSFVSAKVAAAAAAVVVVVGGMATAAYAGALPSTAQGIAHDWIGAPAAHHSHARTLSTEAGKSGTGAASASKRHRRHHFRRFGCYVPGASSKSAAHPSWSPGAHPSWSPGAHPSWSPGAHPSWSPSAHPSWSPRPQSSASASPAPRRTCPPFPVPSRSLRPHKLVPHHRHFPQPPGKPRHSPFPRPTPSVPPTPTPSV